jgi:hypothetical protein
MIAAGVVESFVVVAAKLALPFAVVAPISFIYTSNVFFPDLAKEFMHDGMQITSLFAISVCNPNRRRRGWHLRNHGQTCHAIGLQHGFVCIRKHRTFWSWCGIVGAPLLATSPINANTRTLASNGASRVACFERFQTAIVLERRAVLSLAPGAFLAKSSKTLLVADGIGLASEPVDNSASQIFNRILESNNSRIE